MINHGKIHSTNMPQEIEMTTNSVFVASNITSYSKTIEDRIQSGYEYDCIEYTKDEYLTIQSNKILSLEEELQATKILLGVD